MKNSDCRFTFPFASKFFIVFVVVFYTFDTGISAATSTHIDTEENISHLKRTIEKDNKLISNLTPIFHSLLGLQIFISSLLFSHTLETNSFSNPTISQIRPKYIQTALAVTTLMSTSALSFLSIKKHKLKKNIFKLMALEHSLERRQ